MQNTRLQPLSDEARDLADRLRERIRGEVRFDAGSLSLYTTDSSNYRQVPTGVVIPRDTDDVIETVTACREAGAPILGRGAGTSLAGQGCNAAVVIDFSKHVNHVLELDPDRRLARVEPGTILDDLRNAAEKHHLTFGPDPATHDRCTIGGMLGNNSCGIHSIMSGRMVDNVEELDILTYDGLRMRVGATADGELESIIRAGGRRGEIYSALRSLRDRVADLVRRRFPRLPRRVSGYNLDELLPENGFNVARALVGTEGTCATVLEATLKLIPSPPERALLVLGYPDVFEAADHVMEILRLGPTGLEGMDDYLRNFLQAKRGLRPEEVDLLPEGKGWLLVEFGGDSVTEAEDKARNAMAVLGRLVSAPSMKLTNAREAALVWEVRKSGLGAASILPNWSRTWPGWEDAAVPPERLGGYLRDFRTLRDKYGYESAMYGHFGDGCVHMRIDFDLQTVEGVSKFLRFLDEGADLVTRYGGSLSGEHGDGQARAALLPKMFGVELVETFREFKRIWDPDNRMNPGMVVDAFGPDENLRMGPDYRPWQPETHFHFPESRRQFSTALTRCVGVGRCRRLEGGTMCPSFMVTREEQHSTRGRARILLEMVRGELIRDGWRSEEVKETLELCLACKGCKSDCPVSVDVATYKAEFLSHYYENRLRPFGAYAMGLIYWWARLASVAPGVANAVAQAPLLGSFFKVLAGIAPQRRVPRFAQETFKHWFFKHRPNSQAEGEEDGREPAVILWADTFNNHFSPDTAKAAVEVLEAAGFRVLVPRRSLCCGRPLYDQGMLHLAKRLLQQILVTLRQEIDAGIPIVVLEPSCCSVFRDELPGLFPDDELALKLSRQSYLFVEFLVKCASGWEPPRLGGKALAHIHCHHKSVVGQREDEAMLRKLGLDFQIPDTGCCGMAGVFGFKKSNYEMSLDIAERVLLPAVRATDLDTLIITDGFSCREQIGQCTARRTLHMAQVLKLAIDRSRESSQITAT